VDLGNKKRKGYDSLDGDDKYMVRTKKRNKWMFERSSVEWFYFDVVDLNIINFWSCWFRQLICRFCIQLTASSPIQLNLRHKIASVAGHKTKYEHSFEWFNDAAWFVKGIKLYHCERNNYMKLHSIHPQIDLIPSSRPSHSTDA